MSLYSKIADKDRSNQTIREIAHEVGSTQTRVRDCMNKYRLAWKPTIATLVRSKDRSKQTLTEIAEELGCDRSAVYYAVRIHRLGYVYEEQPSKWAKLIRSKDRSNQTIREIANELGCSPETVRGTLQARGLPYKMARHQVKWYEVAAEVVLRSAESIDSVCLRFGLKPEKLVRRLYES